MNKPAYAAIQTYSPAKPVLVFVSSRRQTRLTALDLIGFAAADERPQQFVHMPEEELENRVALWQKTKLGSYSGWEGYQRCWTTDGLHPEGPAPPAKLSPLGEKLLGTRPWK